MNKFPLTMPFHLRHTLESGQFFQWQKSGAGYIIQSNSRVFYIEQHNTTLAYEPLYGKCDEDSIRSFFRLDDDLTAIFQVWQDDALLPEVYTRFAGLRLMRQHPWECMVSFLCSAASNIPRIAGNIKTLSQRYGTQVELGNTTYSLFPTPEQLESVTVQELYDSGLGFRAKYLHTLVKQMLLGFSLEGLRKTAYLKAREQLTQLYGIGEKIADCILLFSLDHLEAFPIDTWMIRILRSEYFPHYAGADRKLSGLARRKFGSRAGYAQQYLYHYARSKKYQPV